MECTQTTEYTIIKIGETEYRIQVRDQKKQKKNEDENQYLGKKATPPGKIYILETKNEKGKGREPTRKLNILSWVIDQAELKNLTEHIKNRRTRWTKKLLRTQERGRQLHQRNSLAKTVLHMHDIAMPYR